MSKPITAGLIASLLSGMSKAFQNSVADIIDRGLKMEDLKTTEDGGIIFKAVSGGGTVIKVKAVPTSGREGYFDVYIKSKDGKKDKYLGVKEDNIDDKVTEFLDKHYGETLEHGYAEAKEDGEANGRIQDVDLNEFNDETAASQKIQVKLKKVTSSEEVSVKLLSINANYDPAYALADLTNLVNNDSFVAAIPESETCYEIVSDETGYDVNPCEDFQAQDGFEQILKAGYALYLKLVMTHWNIKGLNFREIHNMVGDFAYNLTYELDSIAEIAMQTRDICPNVLELVKQESFDNRIYSNEAECIENIRQMILSYVSALELYYPCFSHDIQSTLDNYIARWKSESEYKLRAMNFGNCTSAPRL